MNPDLETSKDISEEIFQSLISTRKKKKAWLKIITTIIKKWYIKPLAYSNPIKTAIWP